MKYVGYFFALLGFLSMGYGIVCRSYPGLLNAVPVEGLTPSSFIHQGNSFFLIAITMLLIHIVNSKT